MVEVGRDNLRSSSPNLCFNSQLQQVAQVSVQLGFAYLHRWRVHNLSEFLLVLLCSFKLSLFIKLNVALLDGNCVLVQGVSVVLPNSIEVWMLVMQQFPG